MKLHPKQARRRVAKDRTVALAGRLYEAPIALIGKQITLLYHAHDPARIEAAKRAGVDLTLVLEQLRLSPAERVRRMLQAVEAAAKVRGLARETFCGAPAGCEAQAAATSHGSAAHTRSSHARRLERPGSCAAIIIVHQPR